MQLPRTERFISPFLPIYAALGLGAGILLGELLYANGVFACTGEQLNPNPLLFLLPVPLLLLAGWWGRNRRGVLIPALVLTMLLAGAWRYASHPFEPCLGPHDLATYNSDTPYGRPSVLEGVIVGYPDQRSDYVQYRVLVDTLWEGSFARDMTGIALVRSDPVPLYSYGDRIRIRGVPTTAPTFPDFDYRRFLARKGIHTLIKRAELSLLATDQGHPFWAALYNFRARASAILDQLLPQPYAALANGMILGIESGIPRELYEDFNLTGTSHVIVISGSNIAIVSGILLGLFIRLFGRRKRLAVVVTLVGIALYTLLVGADAAVSRAAIMGSLFVIAIGLGRQSTALISLFVAAIAMLLLNPLTLWDVGFQLSFMATLGLILFSKPMQRAWDARIGKRVPRVANNLLAEALLVTLAAQITTMPLVVYYFGRLSLISFLANLLIVPVQPPIMIAGGLATLVGFLTLWLAKLIALIPYASLWWTVFVVEKMAAIPWGSLEVSAFGRMLAALYTLILGLGFLWWLIRQEQQAGGLIPASVRPQLARGVTLAALLILPLWTGATWLESRPDGELHLYLLGRGQGAAFLIVTPGGNRILLDPARESPGYPLEEILTSLPGGNQPLDLLIQTRADDDDQAASIDYRTLLTPAHPSLVPGATLALDSDVTLTLLHQPASDDDSLLFLLRHGDFTTLLPFENSQQAQLDLLDQLPPALTLLTAPYPGAGAWPHPDLLTRMAVQLILAPEGTTYPPQVQTILAGSPVISRVPNDAAIEITSDGSSFAIQIRPYPQDVVRE